MQDFNFCKIRLLKGWQESLWYKIAKKKLSYLNIPENFIAEKESGLLVVQCQLRKKEVFGFVEEIHKELPDNIKFELQEIIQVWLINFSPYINFLEQISQLFGCKKLILLKTLILALKKENKNLSFLDCDLNLLSTNISSKIILSQEQELVLGKIKAIFLQDKFSPILLHGVTGSGKSQIYLQAILEQLKLGKSILFLVPEISLAKNFQIFFETHLPDFKNIFSFHSGELEKNKTKIWQEILQKSALLVIGIHQPIFLPIQNFGLFIIDEEHDSSFLEKKHPFLDTRQIAILRAQIEKIPIIFGSATPSASTYHKAKSTPWNYFFLENRFCGKLPEVEVLKIDPKQKNFWWTNILQNKISETLVRKEQVVLYVNRRGLFTGAKCKVCLLPINCLNCSVSLSLHLKTTELRFECHYCSYFINYSKIICSNCKESKPLILKGVGVDKVRQIVQETFVDAKILLADGLITKKENWAEEIKKFTNSEYDILIGTKTACKGFHFPNVTMVGILIADLDFNFPDYTSTERAIQQILQVSGRAGRSEKSGSILIQAIRPELIEKFSTEKRYSEFLEEELMIRQKFNYPPFSKAIFVQTKNKNDGIAEENINKIQNTIINFLEQNKLEASLLGPTKSLLEKIKNEYYWQLLLKIKEDKSLKHILIFLSQMQKIVSFEFWLEN